MFYYRNFIPALVVVLCAQAPLPPVGRNKEKDRKLKLVSILHVSKTLVRNVLLNGIICYLPF